MNDHTPQPWEQQPDEGDKAYAHFCEYRDLGLTRTYQEVAKKREKTLTYLWKTGQIHDWKERAKAWDNHVEEQWTKEVQEQRRKSAKKHVAIANDMLEKAAEKLATLDLFEMKPADVSKWVEVAVKITRASYGEPDNIAISGPGGGPIQTQDVTTLTPQQRRERLQELRDQINTRLTQEPS